MARASRVALPHQQKLAFCFTRLSLPSGLKKSCQVSKAALKLKTFKFYFLITFTVCVASSEVTVIK
jgi:hypothetical protein